MKTRRRDSLSADVLRAQYAALRERVIAAAPIGALPLGDVKAPVRHVSTLRFIARQEGLATLQQLVDRAAEAGIVSFDIEPGQTLARTVEYLLGRTRVAAPNTRPIPRSSSTAIVRSESSAADPRDSLDDLNDVAEALDAALRTRSLSQWVVDAVHEYVARLRSRVVSPSAAASSTIEFRLALRSMQRLVDAIDGDGSSLFADLADAMSQFGERDGRVAQQLLGVGGDSRLTLEEVGAREGVTRERIRQLYKRFKFRAVSRPPIVLSLFLLQRAADRAGRFVTGYELDVALPPGIISRLGDLHVVEGLLELRWLSGLVPTKLPGVWVRDPNDAAALDERTRLMRRRANRSLRRWGALDVTEYEDVAGQDGPGFVYHLVIRGRRFAMMGAWAVLNEPQRSMLLDRVRRIAEVAPAVSVLQLKRALKKSLRALPPDDVLAACLRRDVPAVDVADVEIRFGDRSTGHLSPSELLARRIIADRGGATTLRTLQRDFVRGGMSAASGGVLFSRSPILERLAHGVVGLIGNSADATVVHDLRKKAKRDALRALVGYRRLTGAVELSYKLDPLLVSNTLFLVPRNLIDLGEWTLTDAPGHVVVRQSYVSGLHQAARACVKSGARRMTVVFHFVSRTVEVTPL